MNMMKTAKTGISKTAAAAMLTASCFMLPFGASAHPLGEGNCWPRYHTWRNAQDTTAETRQQLTDAQASLEEALVSGNIWDILSRMVAVSVLTARLAAAQTEEEELRQLFLDCDHF